jgi:hypothetical protein
MNTELKPHAPGGGSDRAAISGRRFGRRRLQIFAAIGILVSFLVPMVIELSLEPILLAMAAPFAIGLLLMMKWPRVAAIWVGFVSFPVLLFSLPFLGEALTHPESPADFIPLSLFALGSVVGAAGAIPTFREIGAGRVQSKGPPRIATAAAGLLVAVSALSVVTSVGVENMQGELVAG